MHRKGWNKLNDLKKTAKNMHSRHLGHMFAPRKSPCGKPHEANRPQFNLSGGGGGGVPQSWLGVAPVLAREYPCPGVPHSQDWGTPPPRKGPGTRDQGKNLGLGYPSPSESTWDQRPLNEPGTGVPPPPRW